MGPLAAYNAVRSIAAASRACRSGLSHDVYVLPRFRMNKQFPGQLSVQLLCHRGPVRTGWGGGGSSGSSSDGSSSGGLLRATVKSDQEKLACSIFYSLQEQGRVCVAARGAEAVFVALQSIASARGRRAPPGRQAPVADFVTSICWHDQEWEAQQRVVRVMLFAMRALAPDGSVVEVASAAGSQGGGDEEEDDELVWPTHLA